MARDFQDLLSKNDTPFRILVTSNYIVDETLTLLKDRCGSNVAISFRNLLEKSETVTTLWIDKSLELMAWKIFEKYKDKDWSFTDCTSFALADTYRIKNAFAFDPHFIQYKINTVP